ncbi:MAG TPA: ribosome maturation factor RimM, partial [Ktedonobacterales bacterium]|nr:ribosome maturation factor RimM [Ktedonobacterales bacterium]
MSDHPRPRPEPAPRQQRQGADTPAAASDEWVTIGRIVALFGVRGEIKVLPETDLPNRFSQLREVYVGPEHQQQRITKASPYRESMVLLRLAGIDSANAAEALIGQELTIPLAQLPALPADQYYIHDLIGLQVESSSGQKLGVIVDVL